MHTSITTRTHTHTHTRTQTQHTHCREVYLETRGFAEVVVLGDEANEDYEADQAAKGHDTGSGGRGRGGAVDACGTDGTSRKIKPPSQRKQPSSKNIKRTGTETNESISGSMNGPNENKGGGEGESGEGV